MRAGIRFRRRHSAAAEPIQQIGPVHVGAILEEARLLQTDMLRSCPPVATNVPPAVGTEIGRDHAAVGPIARTAAPDGISLRWGASS